MAGRRFRIVRQKDAMQCGVASLAMICQHHGGNYSTTFLDTLCHATTEGVSMLGIANAANSLGMEAVATRINKTKLSEYPLPCILHWNQNHFVVLYKISRNGKRFHIADPAKGFITYDSNSFSQHWHSLKSNNEERGLVMFLKPTDKFGTVKEPANNKDSSLKFLLRYINKYKKNFLTVFFILLLGALLQLLLPFLTQSIVDIGIHNRDINFIWMILAGELFIVAGRTTTDFIRRKLLLKISMLVNVTLISDFIAKLLRLPMTFFDTKLHGDILQRFADHSRVQSFLTGQALSLFLAILTMIVLSAVLFLYSHIIFTVFFIGTLIYGTWISIFMRRRKVLDYEIFQCQSVNQSRTWQLITTMQEIKLQGCGTRRRQEWEEAQANLFKVQNRALKLQQTQEAGSIFINEIKNILITVFAAATVIDGQMTLGAMLAIQFIVGQLNSPIEQLMSFVLALQDVKISMERINEVHLISDENNISNTLTTYADNSGIRLTNVSFRYDPNALAKTIDRISLHIPKGKVTAIVGVSGSGKTTLIKLILAYYPIEEGEIAIAGSLLNEYSPDWWRSRCGVVMQDGVIFSDSISNNIAIRDGDSSVNLEKVKNAAKIACIDQYIDALPLGYDTKIGPDGVGLSQGQKQRILIARAVYQNPDFIFLDEATNALDAKNERAIVKNLKDFYKGRTVIVVAHRLSTVKDADSIAVIDNGHIVETGTHTELVELRGAYYTLIRNQLELGS